MKAKKKENEGLEVEDKKKQTQTHHMIVVYLPTT